MSKRVLVVDDAGFMRMMLKDVLVTNGYEVVGEASSGEEAVDKYQDLHPDLTTMDVVMPGGGGIEALKAILAADPDAKIIMVSAMGQDALVEEAMQAGAKSFIVKPFRPNAVADALKEVLDE